MIQLKSAEQIEGIRKSSRILVETFQFIKELIKAGIKAIEIDREAEEFIRSKKAMPSFKGFRGFPGSVCISIDEEIVHGIPDSRELKKGQIVGIDIGVKYDGFFSDAAYTFMISDVNPQIEKLVRTTRESLYKGIEAAHYGNR
ncbi:MAG: M24 family metallopeptidase, partial [bacterium]